MKRRMKNTISVHPVREKKQVDKEEWKITEEDEGNNADRGQATP